MKHDNETQENWETTPTNRPSIRSRAPPPSSSSTTNAVQVSIGVKVMWLYFSLSLLPFLPTL